MATLEMLAAGQVPQEIADRLPLLEDEGVRVTLSRGDHVPPEGRDAEALLAAVIAPKAFEAMVHEMPRLRWVHTLSSGVDRYVHALRGQGVMLTRTVNARSVTMAEHVLAVTLALLRRLPEAMEHQRRREWRRLEGGTLSGATVGVVGAGSIGSATARLFTAFGARCVGIRRSGEPAPGFAEVWPSTRLRELMAVSDVVVVACPLTAETRGMIAAPELAATKPGAVLVDVSRGGVVVEPDLLAALRAGRVAGAALDVFETEPLPAEHPFWAMPNVIVTAHSSAAGPGVWSAAWDELVANVRRYRSGEPLRGSVDVEGRGY